MKKIFLLMLLLLLAAGGAQAKRWRARHVVVIGLDGWGAYSIPRAHDIPNIRWLMEHGSYSLRDRAVLPSASAINWASMFNGAPTEMHGYMKWNSQRPDIPSMIENERQKFPSVFSIMREQNPEVEMGCLVEWPGVLHVIDTLALNYWDRAEDYEQDPDHLTRLAERYILDKKPNLLAVCYVALDHEGHVNGHDTPKYYDMLAYLDTQVGRVLQAIRDAGMWDDTVILMTADHGGKENGHGGSSILEMEIPFIAYGKGIRQQGEISDVIMQYDMAATIAEVFRLRRPQAWRGQPVWSIFSKK